MVQRTWQMQSFYQEVQPIIIQSRGHRKGSRVNMGEPSKAPPPDDPDFDEAIIMSKTIAQAVDATKFLEACEVVETIDGLSRRGPNKVCVFADVKAEFDNLLTAGVDEHWIQNRLKELSCYFKGQMIPEMALNAIRTPLTFALQRRELFCRSGQEETALVYLLNALLDSVLQTPPGRDEFPRQVKISQMSKNTTRASINACIKQWEEAQEKACRASKPKLQRPARRQETARSAAAPAVAQPGEIPKSSHAPLPDPLVNEQPQPQQCAQVDKLVNPPWVKGINLIFTYSIVVMANCIKQTLFVCLEANQQPGPNQPVIQPEAEQSEQQQLQLLMQPLKGVIEAYTLAS